MKNDEQGEYWNGAAAPGRIRQSETLDRTFAELTADALDAAGFRPGERALDLCCGSGTTSLEIARRVGPEGRVSGFELSRPMLVHAARRARDAGLHNVHFDVRDFQSGDLGRGADVAFSRFGLAFSQDPLTAFGNILDALHSGGRLHFLCWGDPDRNPYLTCARGELSRCLGLPSPEPDTPGHFGLADGPRTRRLLESAGFEEVLTEEWEARLRMPSSRDAFRVLGDLDGSLRPRLEAMPPSEMTRLMKGLEASLAPYETAEGLEVPGLVWWVSAWRALEAA
jgi:SAM-dependent methyltransferase